MNLDDWMDILRGALLAVLLVLVTAAAVLADEQCPADKPFKRYTVRYPVTVTCTTLACSSRLKCEPDSSRCYSVVEDCNKCSPAPVEEAFCLSREELDAALR